jgi:hypothetical protein
MLSDETHEPPLPMYGSLALGLARRFCFVQKPNGSPLIESF